MSTGYDYSSFADPSASKHTLERVRLSWMCQQWEDLVATLTILHEVADYRVWAASALSALERLNSKGRDLLVSDPSFVSWQLMAEVLIYGDADEIQACHQRGFDHRDFYTFALAAGLASGTVGHEATLQPHIAFTLAGTGGTLLSGDRPVYCSVERSGLLVDSLLVELTADSQLPVWTEIDAEEYWRALATPLYEGRVEIDARSPYLTKPFESDCDFGIPMVADASTADCVLREALETLRGQWPELWEEFLLINRHVVFYSDLINQNTISSFSNNSVPGAVFLCPIVSGKPIGLGDLLDSLIHEHSHQKLYLLESQIPLYDSSAHIMCYPSPWKEGPRPLSGLLHGYFVFAIVGTFWRRVAMGQHQLSRYASRRVEEVSKQLSQVHKLLAIHCPFTQAGRDVFHSMTKLEAAL